MKEVHSLSSSLKSPWKDSEFKQWEIFVRTLLSIMSLLYHKKEQHFICKLNIYYFHPSALYLLSLCQVKWIKAMSFGVYKYNSVTYTPRLMRPQGKCIQIPNRDNQPPPNELWFLNDRQMWSIYTINGVASTGFHSRGVR